MKAVCLLAGLLGLLAVPDAEGAALPISTLRCFSTGPSCAGGAGSQQLPEENGLAGVKMWANQPQTFHMVCPDPNDCREELARVELNIRGLFSGTYASGLDIPFHWDFTIGYGGPGSVNRWLLVGNILDDGGNFTSFVLDGAGAGHFSGSGMLTSFGLTDGMDLTISAQILAYWQGPDGDQLTITIPENSMDFGAMAVPTAGTPEPGSFGLLFGGLVGMIARRMRG